jgi:hypothetical protein
LRGYSTFSNEIVTKSIHVVARRRFTRSRTRRWSDLKSPEHVLAFSMCIKTQALYAFEISASKLLCCVRLILPNNYRKRFSVPHSRCQARQQRPSDSVSGDFPQPWKRCGKSLRCANGGVLP